MKTLVIIIHPSLSLSVVNKAWAEALQKEASCDILDLCVTYPDDQIDIKSEQDRLRKYDRIIFQFPLYWYGAPYLLKKYMDVVFTDGYAYGNGGDALEGVEMGVAVSCGSAECNFVEGGQQRHTLDAFMYTFDGVCGFLRSQYIGVIHSFFDTYNPTALLGLPDNARAYAEKLKK